MNPRRAPQRRPRRYAVSGLAVGMLLGTGGIALAATHHHAKHAVERVTGGPTGTYVVPSGIHKIKHVIIIMQENRSFDSYFGTFPGATGFPRRNGHISVCIPDPGRGRCVRPYHDTADINGGGPHSDIASVADIAGGKMNGFAMERDAVLVHCKVPSDPACRKMHGTAPDVMGYHTAAEIPNYWTYAKDFVLDDHMFEPDASSSLSSHLYMVSGWSAKCANASPSSCKTLIRGPYNFKDFNRQVYTEVKTGKTQVNLAWTDVTWLLHAQHVSWSYYVETGTQPDCPSGSETCPKIPQNYWTLGIWNPLPLFNDVHTDHQANHVRPLRSYLRAAKRGRLPSVSWITPSGANSEHPPSSVHQGQAYVTALINAAMKGPEWKSTAIFLGWDDWGGFYDNVVPPTIDASGYGIRVPGIVISPYAKHGYVDHQVLSSDAYLKFIEDDFLHGSRLNPKTDGRPDPRPDVRTNAPQLGNLVQDFNFSQKPRKPVLLPTNPPSDSPTLPTRFVNAPPCVGCTAIPTG